ncbi:MAG: pyruvate kinase [Bacteroidota bacterium]
MKIKEDVIHRIIGKLDAILAKMNEDEIHHAETMEDIDSYYKKSAQNLLNYVSFRSFDVREIQKHLKNLGLTRFVNAEGHIKASVLTIRHLLGLAVSHNEQAVLKKQWSIKKGRKLLNRNTKDLLGKGSTNRRVRIMVTQPREAANNYEMVREMVDMGMDCARINCAHDSPEIWSAIISNIKKAADELQREVKIAMDLAGPKIRTGKIIPGPRVIRYKPQKDDFGRVVEPKQIILESNPDTLATANTLPIRTGDLDGLSVGMLLSFVDARSKHRKLKVVAKNGGQVIVESRQTLYVEPDLVLSTVSNEPLEFIVGTVPFKENAIVLKMDDEIWLMKDQQSGTPAEFDVKGNLLHPAKISCQMLEVFDYIQPGDRVYFDDGKIGGKVTEIQDEHVKVRIFLAKENGSKLREEKGINFPDTILGFSGLTPKDRTDLEFVVAHADIVNFSFVNRKEDITELYKVLEDLDALDRMAIILKIETQTGFHNLTPILLEAMKTKNIGVMIARGDLAIETGWENIGRVQQEILSICGGAHIPVIWATQVLENLAKNGLPSRSEITDATTALKAECVMLNKGPYINLAITLLSNILSKMESSQNKNEPMLPRLKSLVKS